MARKGKSKLLNKSKDKGKGRGRPSNSSTRTTKSSKTATQTSSSTPNDYVPRPRSHSQGLFGRVPPAKPFRVDIHGGHIEDDLAKKTLLGCIRGMWPVGLYTFRDIEEKDPKWCQRVMDMFGKYFKHKKGQSREDAYNSILMHMKATCKRVICDEKRRAMKKVARGKSIRNVRPSFFSPQLWEGLIKYWNSEKHQQLSSAGSKNRGKVKTLHSAGAKSFNKVEQEMMEELGGEQPKKIDLWKRTHTRKKRGDGEEEYTTPEAMAIAARYANILEDNADIIAQGGVEPIEWWLRATQPNDGLKAKKNMIIGYPRIPANRLLQSRKGGSNSSRSASKTRSAIPDPVFIELVREVVEGARTNPPSRELSETEVDSLAQRIVDRADPNSRADFRSIIMQEVKQTIGTIMNDLLQKYQTRAQMAIDNENQDESFDYTDEDEDSGDEVMEDGEQEGDEESDGDSE